MLHKMESQAVHMDSIMKNFLNGQSTDYTQERISALKREDVEKPVIYVGTGTCGLGAGAAKTLEAVKNLHRGQCHRC